MNRPADIMSWLSSVGEETWLMEPRRLTAWLTSLGSDTLARGSMRRGTSDGLPFEVRDGIAQIRVSGVLLPRVPWWMGGATSTAQLTDEVGIALQDPRVRGILLRVSSPGGAVSGIGPLADAIHAARGRKPIHAHAEDMIASAAYWLGSQASRLTAEATAEIGSIGAYRAVVDSTEAYAREGLKVHLVKSGPHKGAGHQGVPVTEEQLGRFQSLIDGLTSIFVGAVARGRDRDRGAIEPMATGATWLAADAARLGLIDAVETADAAHSTMTVAGGDGLSPVRLANDPASAPAQPMELDMSQPSSTAPAAASAAPVATTTTTPAIAPATPAAPQAASPSADEIGALRTELAVTQQALASANARAAAFEEQLAAVQRLRKDDVLAAAQASGLVAPSALEAFRKVSATMADTNEGVESFRALLSTMPRVTRPHAESERAQDTRDGSPSVAEQVFTAEERADLEARGKDPEAIARSNQVATFLEGGKARLKNGSIVVLADYLNTKKPAPAAK